MVGLNTRVNLWKYTYSCADNKRLKLEVVIKRSTLIWNRVFMGIFSSEIVPENKDKKNPISREKILFSQLLILTGILIPVTSVLALILAIAITDIALMVVAFSVYFFHLAIAKLFEKYFLEKLPEKEGWVFEKREFEDLF